MGQGGTLWRLVGLPRRRLPDFSDSLRRCILGSTHSRGPTPMSVPDSVLLPSGIIEIYSASS
jgi:hypothetical protein